MISSSNRQFHLIPIPVPPVKPLLRRTIKRFLRLLPSILLLLFVFSLIFVTLMQIAVIHANRRFTINKVSTFSSSSLSSSTSSSLSVSPTIRPLRQVNQIQTTGNTNNVLPSSSNGQHSVSSNVNENIVNDKVSNSTMLLSASISHPTSSSVTKDPKNPQLLSIEGLLDKKTASRDQSNSNYFQNLINSQLVKKIINSIMLDHKFGLSSVNSSNISSEKSFHSSSSALSTVPNSSSLLSTTNTSLGNPNGSSSGQSGLKHSCPEVLEQLVGRIKIDLDINSNDWTSDESTWHSTALKQGGSWEPEHCNARHRVAIIIPYRDRLEHLRILLHHLHPILQRQLLNYKVYVIEQSGNETFNKGVLMNAGVKEALKDSDYHCFIFHDVDLIPEDDRNLYSCPFEPRHMSVAVDKFNYSLPYAYLVGGVFAITKADFVQVNGYSNLYWGWGGEDDDMAYRLKFHNLNITRPPESVGRYTMIKHSHRAESPDIVRTALLRMAKRRATRDGFNSVQYTILDRKEEPDYCHISIEISSIHRWSFPSKNKLVIHF
ncbi:beta-1,4-galactosyltransferase 4-like [Panonychus citri]|uniref:beta-1,4-galactosyltransferase 4-like n=1 Tax=Panonychus citri TaxID=50023 RepID=UPI00230821B8|nr:beta-1,4-galactosyltransferase 4-like [Panonychus citri]